MATKPAGTKQGTRAKRASDGPHGIPITVENTEGISGVPERVFFASVRRSERTGAALRKASAAVDAQVEASIANQEVANAAENSVATADLLDAYQQTRKLEDAAAEAVAEFFRVGLSEAGYTDDEVERIVVWFDPTRFNEVRLRALTGIGKVDFTLPAA